MYKKIEWLYIGKWLVYVPALAYSEVSFNLHWRLKMANIIRTDTKSPTLPKMHGKLFAAFKIEPFVHNLIFGKGLNPADTITPSAIGMNAHAARSSLGGTVSVPGFITGLCWSLCAIAHGQKKLSTLQEGLPIHSAYALACGASQFKHGAGVSAGSLETIVLASLKAMLALPAPSKRLADAAAADAADAAAADAAAADAAAADAAAADAAAADAADAAAADAAAADAAAADAAAADAAAANAADAATADAADAAAADAADAAAADAAAADAAAADAADAATAAANAAAETEQAPANYVRSITSLPHDEAVQQLRAIALALGFRLVRIKAA